LASKQRLIPSSADFQYHLSGKLAIRMDDEEFYSAAALPRCDFVVN
jgi:hypothetical protein